MLFPVQSFKDWAGSFDGVSPTSGAQRLPDNHPAELRNELLRHSPLEVINATFLEQIRCWFAHCIPKCVPAVKTTGKNVGILRVLEWGVAHPRWGSMPIRGAIQ